MTRLCRLALVAGLLVTSPALAQGSADPIPQPGRLAGQQAQEPTLSRINDVMDMLYRQMSGPWQQAEVAQPVRETVNSHWADVVQAWETVRRAENGQREEALRTFETALTTFTTAYEAAVRDLEGQQTPAQ